MHEFAKFMTSQLDLRVEAHNLTRFARNFEKTPSVRFPKPIGGYCQEHVLVESYEPGRHISAACVIILISAFFSYAYTVFRR